MKLEKEASEQFQSITTINLKSQGEVTTFICHDWILAQFIRKNPKLHILKSQNEISKWNLELGFIGLKIFNQVHYDRYSN